MFEEIEFGRVKQLPKYVFAEVNELKMQERRAGNDVIDFQWVIQMVTHQNI